MKTPEEIKKGLECAMPRSCNGHECSTCPNATYSLHELLKGDLIKDTFDYIEQLEHRLAQVERERDELSLKNLFLETSLESVTKEYTAVKRERDAAVRDLEELTGRVSSFHLDCDYCKDKDKPVCRNCEWKWRGVCGENSK